MDSFLPVWLKKHKPSEDSRFFHYTTLSGLRGILNHRALWCGHISTFNDPLEIQYGKNLIIDVLNHAMEQEEHQEVRNLLRSVLISVQAFGEQLHDVFAACFCESGSLLSQWRAYANRGGGYSLEFQFSSNTQITSNIDKPDDWKFPFLRRVIYNENDQRSLVKQYLDSIVAGSKKVFKTGHPHASPAAVMALQAVNVLIDMLIQKIRMGSVKLNYFTKNQQQRQQTIRLSSSIVMMAAISGRNRST